jgi:hypothetical protein
MKIDMNINHYLVEYDDGTQDYMIGKDIRDVLEQCTKDAPIKMVMFIFKKEWTNTEDDC